MVVATSESHRIGNDIREKALFRWRDRAIATRDREKRSGKARTHAGCARGCGGLQGAGRG